MKKYLFMLATLLSASASAFAPISQGYTVVGSCYADYFTQPGSYSDFTCTFALPHNVRGDDIVMTTATTGDPDVSVSVFDASAYNTGPLGLSGASRADIGFRVTNASRDRNIVGIVRVNVILTYASSQTRAVRATQ